MPRARPTARGAPSTHVRVADTAATATAIEPAAEQPAADEAKVHRR